MARVRIALHQFVERDVVTLLDPAAWTSDSLRLIREGPLVTLTGLVMSQRTQTGGVARLLDLPAGFRPTQQYAALGITGLVPVRTVGTLGYPNEASVSNEPNIPADESLHMQVSWYTKDAFPT